LTDPKTKKEYTVEEAARLYLNTWGIGDSVKNNGVLLLISRKPRRIAIEVGWGLMAVLNYPFCKGIIDSTMAPAFKNDNYFTGLKDAVTALENKVDDPVPPPQRVTKPLRTSHSHLYTLQSASSEDEPLGKDFFMIIVGLVGGLILIVIIAMLRKESDGYYDGEGYYRRERRRRDKQMIESLSGNSSRGSFSSSSFSSSSSSSRSSSLSSSSSSYGGGGSSGGGASGSW
jgi:uncharacterized protein